MSTSSKNFYGNNFRSFEIFESLPDRLYMYIFSNILITRVYLVRGKRTKNIRKSLLFFLFFFLVRYFVGDCKFSPLIRKVRKYLGLYISL